MSNKLYVGNLSFETTDTELQDLFAKVGPVQEAMIIQDRATGRSRGFGFVTMVTPDDANEAINQLNGQTINGRAISVTIARPLESRSGGGAGGGGRSFRDGGNRGGGGGGRGGNSFSGDRRRSERSYDY